MAFVSIRSRKKSSLKPVPDKILWDNDQVNDSTQLKHSLKTVLPIFLNSPVLKSLNRDSKAGSLISSVSLRVSDVKLLF